MQTFGYDRSLLLGKGACLQLVGYGERLGSPPPKMITNVF